MPNDFYEKTVEQIIFDNRDTIHLYGLPKFRKTSFRQFILPSGKKIDIISFDINDGHLVVDIYELKLYDINTDAICQAYNYFIEVNSITKGAFKSVDIHIIMIGRNYTPVMIFEKMNHPFSVYTYDYTLKGMSFLKHQERRSAHVQNDYFSMGLWAFGTGLLYYPNGQPNTVNLANIYKDWMRDNPDSGNSLFEKVFNPPKEIIKEIPVVQYVEKDVIETQIFPLQPGWTKEFAREIPPDEHMFDIQDDESEYEGEPIEADLSDYEPEEDDKEEEDEFNINPDEIVWVRFAEPEESELPIIQVNDFLKRITA